MVSSRSLISIFSVPAVLSATGDSVAFLGANDVLALGIDDTDTAGDIVAQLTKLQKETAVVLGAGTDSRLILSGGFLQVAPGGSFTAGEDVQVDVTYTTGIDVDMISILLPVVEVAGPVIDPRVYLPTDIFPAFPRNGVLAAPFLPENTLIKNTAINPRFVNAVASS